jgi:hypothetical protein
MPMYYPDLKSVAQTAKLMSGHDGDKKYTGLIPKTQAELSEARRQLAAYFRNVWRDRIAAMEVEYAATKENYDEVMRKGICSEVMRKGISQ